MRRLSVFLVAATLIWGATSCSNEFDKAMKKRAKAKQSHVRNKSALHGKVHH